MDVRICQYTCRGRVCLPECAHNIEQLMSSGRPAPTVKWKSRVATDSDLGRAVADAGDGLLSSQVIGRIDYKFFIPHSSFFIYFCIFARV